MTLQDGQRTDQPVVLAEAVAPDPDLAAGKWMTIAAQASGHSYELWLNGKSVARGTDAPTTYDEPNSIKYAVQLAAWPVADGLVSVDLDYVALWELPGPLPERKP